MTKIAMVHLVDAILKRIPVPYLPEAAAGLDALVDALAPANPQDWKDGRDTLNRQVPSATCSRATS